MFLIACLLRKLPRKIVKEWEEMLEINVEESDIFKRVYDQATATAYRRVIAAKLEIAGLPVRPVVEKLADIEEQALGELMMDLLRTDDPGAIWFEFIGSGPNPTL